MLSTLTELEETGYCLLPDIRMDGFISLLSDLGRVWAPEEITVQSGSSLYIRSNRSIPLHNEDPHFRYVAWFCKQAARDGGDTLLLDGTSLSDQLPKHLKASLGKLVCPHRNRQRAPILSDNGDWYFIPWSLPHMSTAHERQAISDLMAAIDEKQKISLRMRPNDAVIIDNRRMLHGRTSFSDDTRAIVRYTIE